MYIFQRFFSVHEDSLWLVDEENERDCAIRTHAFPSLFTAPDINRTNERAKTTKKNNNKHKIHTQFSILSIEKISLDFKINKTIKNFYPIKTNKITHRKQSDKPQNKNNQQKKGRRRGRKKKLFLFLLINLYIFSRSYTRILLLNIVSTLNFKLTNTKN